MFESAKCIFLQERLFFILTPWQHWLLRLLCKIKIHIGDEIIKVFKGKGVRMKWGIYWANVWKGGVGMLERWDKEDWQEATMHKMKRKKMKRRTCVEEHANSLMLEAVWSTFRVPLIANIPICLVTHLWKLVSATDFFLKGNIDFYCIILMFFF